MCNSEIERKQNVALKNRLKSKVIQKRCANRMSVRLSIILLAIINKLLNCVKIKCYSKVRNEMRIQFQNYFKIEYHSNRMEVELYTKISRKIELKWNVFFLKTLSFFNSNMKRKQNVTRKWVKRRQMKRMSFKNQLKIKSQLKN